MNHNREQRIKQFGLCGICKLASFMMGDKSCPSERVVKFEDNKITKCNKAKLLPENHITPVDCCFRCKNYENGYCMIMRVPVGGDICSAFEKTQTEPSSNP